MNNKRAEQFLPFDALKGFKEAIKEKEIIYIEKVELNDEIIRKINFYLNNLKRGQMIKIIHYANGKYLISEGLISEINKIYKYLKIVKTKIEFKDIYDIFSSDLIYEEEDI